MASQADRAGGLADARYCAQCGDRRGQLRPFEAVLEALIVNDYMGRNGLDRGAAEIAARNALARQPAWRK
ncbi:MAG: hypothetical protein JNK72_22490 [Myxococcales bacterium]|nr:hypothetical protein [Myxococcales bacterium]